MTILTDSKANAHHRSPVLFLSSPPMTWACACLPYTSTGRGRSWHSGIKFTFHGTLKKNRVYLDKIQIHCAIYNRKNTVKLLSQIQLSCLPWVIWVSEWLLFNANSAIFQLYHGENKLIFNEMMMRSALY